MLSPTASFSISRTAVSVRTAPPSVNRSCKTRSRSASHGTLLLENFSAPRLVTLKRAWWRVQTAYKGSLVGQPNHFRSVWHEILGAAQQSMGSSAVVPARCFHFHTVLADQHQRQCQCTSRGWARFAGSVTRSAAAGNRFVSAEATQRSFDNVAVIVTVEPNQRSRIFKNSSPLIPLTLRHNRVYTAQANCRREFASTSMPASRRDKAAGNVEVNFTDAEDAAQPATAAAHNVLPSLHQDLYYEKALAPLEARLLVVKQKLQRLLSAVPERSSIGFGQSYTDHMIEADWDDQHGWYAPVLRPMSPLSIHPGISALHYALSAFDGLKVFRTADDRLLLFRGLDHAHRFSLSARRVALPSVEPHELIKLCKNLARIDERFIYKERGLSLYLRPIVFSTYPTLGVHAPRMAKMLILACPTAGYFASAGEQTNLYVEKQFTRSWPGGSGSFKVAANYAPSIVPCKMRMHQGFQQLLWTIPVNDGEDYLWCEGGAMSLFIHWVNEKGEEELATPALERDLILPGIMRDTVLSLARCQFPTLQVAERQIFMRRDFIRAYAEGRVREIFCTGTGAVVMPVGIIHFDGVNYDCSIERKKNKENSLALKLLQIVYDIQYGVVPHHFVEEC